MTDREKIQEYMREIYVYDGHVADFVDDPEGVPMRIAKLQDIWRKLVPASLK